MQPAEPTKSTVGRTGPFGHLPLERPAPLREIVRERLLAMIVSRELQPGHHLVENELAAALGVSRQPVREALLQLQAEGWVDQRPGQGTFVHNPTDSEADELLGVRAVLEAESARLAAQHTTPTHIERLRALLRDGEVAVAADDAAALVSANAAFHSYIVSMSGNHLLAQMLGAFELRVRWYHATFARIRGRASWDEHTEVVEAIAAENSTLAHDRMRRHAERTREGYRRRVR